MSPKPPKYSNKVSAFCIYRSGGFRYGEGPRRGKKDGKVGGGGKKTEKGRREE